MWTTAETLIRAHTWSPLELFALLMVLGCLAIVAVDMVFDGLDALGAWWQRRRMRGFLTGGTHGYADSGRRHRETAREVARLAARVPDSQPAVPVAGPTTGHGSLRRSHTTTAGVAAPDRATDYGRSVVLVSHDKGER